MDRFHVVVVGGGIGGVCSAVSAARAGASVLLVERLPTVGGTGVHSPVALICTFFDRSGRIINDGLHREFFPQAYQGEPHAMYTYDASDLARRYRTAIEAESGITLWEGSQVDSVGVTDGQIKSLTISGSKSGEVCGSVVVDATAEGFLSQMVGAEMIQDQDTLQPATLTFVVGGVDFSRFACDLPSGGMSNWKEYEAVRAELGELYRKLKAAGQTTNPRDDVLLFPLPGQPGRVLFNQTRIHGVVPWDQASVERGLEEGRKQIEEFWSAIREHPAFENAHIESISPKLGTREGRRVRGDYVLTKDDCLGEARFADMVAAGAYAIDVHPPAGGKLQMVPIPGSGYYHIPYRCLIAHGFRNLLLGSRCISGTHEAHGSYRVMSTLSAVGMAAGVAAALTASGGASDVRDTSASDIRAELQRQGQWVESYPEH